ncbi:FMN-binding protein [Caloranaerobacter ferrireducens]|uniref:FMN-binding protein n=1 Tax=Caloranaerobacter ferrireducens TaxID=1323370 RepID=UPI00084D07CE|nr:FMN-binding protein [Caloranaerobacter ferrireducens]
MKRISYIIIFTIITMLVITGCNSVTDKNMSYKDGTYKASDDYDKYGWKAEISITYEDGKIVDVVFNEVNKEGQNKNEDKEYAEKMKEASGITPEDVKIKLEKELISKQDVDKVDVVTGATYTSERFKKLAKKAMNKNMK